MKTAQILQYIKTHCTADDYSLHVSQDESHETRFAQNGITQHIAGPQINITLNVSFGKRSGSCSVNRADAETLAYMVKTAQDIAQMAPEDPEHMPSALAQELPVVQNSAKATKALSPKKMVDIVQKSIHKAIALDATVSGMCEKHLSHDWMFTKNGFRGENEYSSFGHSMTLKKGQVETKVSYEAKDFAPFDLDVEFDRLSAQAEALGNMQDFDAQKIAVILRPEALQELLWFMNWGLNRRQADEGLSPYSDQLGKACFGKKFSMYSTLKRPEMIARPFDGEGNVSREIAWIKSGVLKAMNTNRYWAQKVGAEAQSSYNVYVPGGDTTEAQMMKMVARGLIINRFWYIRTVDMKTGELTGMTRDGVLYFEDGKIRHAVNNLRFNEIPQDLTRRILALGANKLTSPSMNLPCILVDNFNFVDKTTF